MGMGHHLWGLAKAGCAYRACKAMVNVVIQLLCSTSIHRKALLALNRSRSVLLFKGQVTVLATLVKRLMWCQTVHKIATHSHGLNCLFNAWHVLGQIPPGEWNKRSYAKCMMALKEGGKGRRAAPEELYQFLPWQKNLVEIEANCVLNSVC